MRQRTIGLGLLLLALCSGPGQPGVRADVIDFTERSGLGFVQTDFSPLVNVGGNDPVTLNKFNPGSGSIPADAILQNVKVAFDWGFQSQISGSFQYNSDPASSISINAFGGITLARPNMSITGAGPDSGVFLFPTQTFQNSATFTSATPGSFATTPISTYFHSLPTGYVVPTQDQPLNLRNAGSPLVTNITPGSSDFSKFLGPGTVRFDAMATAGFNIPNTSGNATGTSMTNAFLEVTLTYTYSTNVSPTQTGSIPEPTTLAIMGIGVGGFLLARKFRQHQATEKS